MVADDDKEEYRYRKPIKAVYHDDGLLVSFGFTNINCFGDHSSKKRTSCYDGLVLGDDYDEEFSYGKYLVVALGRVLALGGRQIAGITWTICHDLDIHCILMEDSARA